MVRNDKKKLNLNFYNTRFLQCYMFKVKMQSTFWSSEISAGRGISIIQNPE